MTGFVDQIAGNEERKEAYDFLVWVFKKDSAPNNGFEVMVHSRPNPLPSFHSVIEFDAFLQGGLWRL